MSAVALQQPRRLRAVEPAAEHVELPAPVSGRRTLVLALATAFAIVAAVFGTVGLNALAANAAVDARDLEQQVAQAELDYAELVAAVAAKEDPGRIRELALGLGLVPSDSARHLVLSRGLEADGLRLPDAGGMVADPLKPVLTQER